MTLRDKGFCISIVTVVLNSKDLISKTIESIIKQTYKNIEYLVIDGGSSDGTVDIINKYSSQITKILIEADKGIYDAMNKSLKLASGDFLLFMNAGDIFCSSQTVADAIQYFADNSSVYYGNALSINKEGIISVYKGEAISKLKLAKTNICHQTIFYPRKIYTKNEFNLKYRLYSDWEYNMKIFRKNKFIYLNQNIAIYDMAGLTSLSRDINFKNDQIKLIINHLGYAVFATMAISKLMKSVLNLLQIFKSRVKV